MSFSIFDEAANKNDDVINITNFIKSGANPNVLDTQGNTPLMIALKHGNTNVGKLLIEFGVNINVVLKWDQN